MVELHEVSHIRDHCGFTILIMRSYFIHGMAHCGKINIPHAFPGYECYGLPVFSTLAEGATNDSI